MSEKTDEKRDMFLWQLNEWGKGDIDKASKLSDARKKMEKQSRNADEECETK